MASPLSNESTRCDVFDPFSPSFDIDATTQGWQVKRKGHALRLRLARNRFLQIAVDPLASPSALSPLSQNSEPFVQAQASNLDFETNGMVWVEIPRRSVVTALAMSRTRKDMPSTNTAPRPLLMAFGDESGMVSVTEILDEHVPPRPPTSGNQQRQNFGATIEFLIQGRIRSMDFSPDDQYLLVGGDGCIATILSIVLDEVTRKLEDLKVLQQVEREDRIYSVLFNPLGSHISIAGFDGKISICSTEAIMHPDPTLTEISRFGLILCVGWKPESCMFAVGGTDKLCGIYDNNYKLVHEVSCSTSVQTVRWHPDGKYLAIASRGEISILDGSLFGVKCELSNYSSENNAKYRVEDLCWSPDGSFLAIGGVDGICLIVETKTFALVHEVHRPSPIMCLSWGQRDAPGFEQYRYLTISDKASGVALVKAGIESDSSEIDGASSIASSAYFSTRTKSEWILRENSFRDIDESSVELARDIKTQGTVTAVAFSRANKSKGSVYLAYAADDCSLTIMTTRDWKAVFQMEFAKPLRDLVFSNSNNYLVLAGDESVVYVLSVPSRSIVFNTIISAAISTLAFSRYDERLSIGSMDGVMTFLCPDADWEQVGEVDYSDSAILCQDWSTKTLAIGRKDGGVAIFDAEKAFDNFFVPVAEFSYVKPVRSLAFGASGRFLAVVGDNGLLSILSSKGGWSQCHQFKSHSTCTQLLAVSWSPAGRYLIFAGSNRTCRIIDTITWTEVVEVKNATDQIFENMDALTDAISQLDWSLDGKWIALGTIDGGIYALGTSKWQLLVVPSNDRLALLVP